MSRVVPIIAGTQDDQCESGENIVFTNLEKFHPDIIAPKPGLYYGARTSQIDERVRVDLGSYIIPSTEDSSPAAPNFFLEAKSKVSRSDVLQRQAMYNGAIGERGILKLKNYKNPTPTYDGNAYTGTTTYHPGEGILKLYSTHARQSTSGKTEYYLTQLRSFAMTDTPEIFRQGAAAYRNYRDYNQEQRDRFIANANAIAIAQRQSIGGTPSSGTSSRTATISRSFDSNTSADGFALDHAAVSFANSDLSEPERHGRPFKRAAHSPSTSAHLRPQVNASASDVHTRNRRRQLACSKAQDDNTDISNGSDNDDDNEGDNNIEDLASRKV